jgi:hypothetical protein
MSGGIAGNHRDTGASRDTRFSPTSCSTTAAVNALVLLAMRNRCRTSAGSPRATFA